ncbi:universal stress protein [Sanguibacter antarcticus]|uniref:Nucleotide-binding universal stress UspA family protein n=1 Tax=Sanguibacter antarcticus TaxID=372484 RepID=A0A2A9E2W6_9MICO|nr:universal stress protein [Sanguibacter antarcticus]PFG32996.1 nucleotide-binding universal stress UspA family protein [Sanguibacter antarcticus]
MTEHGSVVIALDGSPHSAQTLEWGMAEAVLRGTDAILVRACPGTRDINRIGWYPLLEDEMFEAESRAYLEKTLPRVRERWPDVEVSTRLLHGSEVPVLRDISRGAALLVIGARGRSGRRRLGSTGAHIAAHALSPVAVVRDVRAPSDSPAPVVVGVDGSPSSLLAARLAAAEASLRGAPLVVVHARPKKSGRRADGEQASVGDRGASDERASTDGMAEVARTLAGDHPGLDVTVDVRLDDPARALIAAGRDAQLIVVGSRGLGAFRGILMGSVSSEVLRKAERTVLVVRTGPEDATHGDAPAGGSEEIDG